MKDICKSDKLLQSFTVIIYEWNVHLTSFSVPQLLKIMQYYCIQWYINFCINSQLESFSKLPVIIISRQYVSDVPTIYSNSFESSWRTVLSLLFLLSFRVLLASPLNISSLYSIRFWFLILIILILLLFAPLFPLLSPFPVFNCCFLASLVSSPYSDNGMLTKGRHYMLSKKKIPINLTNFLLYTKFRNN